MHPISRTLAVLALATAAAAADAPRQYLPNGDFEEGDKAPAGWRGIHTGTDTENRFVRLTASPDRPASATSSFQLGAKPPRALELACQVRTEGAAGPASGIAVTFRDAEGKVVLPAPAVLAVDGPAGWRQVKRRFFVPAGAVAIEVVASVGKAAGGTLDIDNLALTTVHPVYVPAEERFAGTVAIEAGGKPPAALRVDGNRLVDQAGAAVRLQGIAVPGPEPQAIAMAIELWRANAVRIDLDRAAWSGEAYRAAIGQAVRAAASRGAYAVLELRGQGAPGAADAAFWKDAAARFKDEPAAVFALFQQPKGLAWDAWQGGMQSLLDAVRGAGAANLVIAEGLDGYDLSGAKPLNGAPVAYGSTLDPTRRGWQEKLLAPAATLPVVVLDVGCPLKPAAGGEDPFTWAPDALAALQAANVSWIAGTMAADAPNALIAANRTPSAWWGCLVRSALSGAKLTSDRKR